MALRRAAGRVAPALVPFLLAIVLLAPATLGGKVLSAGDLPLASPPFAAGTGTGLNPLQFDAAYVFEPDGLQVRQALRDFRLPVWTPHLSSGRPLLAAQQSAPLFPATWIGAVFPYYDSQAWIAVLKLALAALGTYAFARALGLRRGTALLGGIAFGFGTYLVVWLMHPHDNAYVLLPWLLLGAERLVRRGALRDGALLGVLFGLAYLSGQPESALIVSMPTAAWFAYRLAVLRPPRPEAVRRAVIAVAAVGLGAALAAVMLLPLAEALRESFHPSRSGEPLGVKSILTLVFPDYWGRPDRVGVFAGGPQNFTERTLYAGALPSLLAVMGLVARRPRGPQAFFAVLTVLALAVALDTGPLTDAVRGLPVLDAINVNRVLILASFAIAMLAALGAERLLDGTAAERRRMLIAGAAVGLGLPLVALAVHPGWFADVPDAARRLLGRGPEPVAGSVVAVASILRWLVLAAIALALLFALVRRPRRATVLVGAAIALVALDLGAMGWGYNPAITPAQAEPPAPPAIGAMRRLTDGGGRVVGIDGLEPNTASRWGLDDVRGHEDPGVERTDMLWGALGGGVSGATTGVTRTDPRSRKLLDVFGVRALLVAPSATPGADLAPALRGPVAYSGPGGAVIEHPTALPRAFVAYRWRPSASATASAFLVASGTRRQARDAPAIESAGRSPAGPAPPATPARITARTDTSVTLDVDARASGHLVLLDTYYPGWDAEVDGHPATIRPADTAFRSVAVGPGRHVVRFTYRPASVRVGGIISLVALVVLALGLAFGRRRTPAEAATA